MAYIGIIILSGRDHNPYFTKSLVEFVTYLAVQRKHSFATIFRTNVSNIAAGRQGAMLEAIAMGCSHALFIDDDMVFPKDMLDTMLLARAEVVGLNAVKKIPGKLNFCAVGYDGKECSSVGAGGCQGVNRVGAGIMLINLSVMPSVMLPWFEQKYDTGTGKFHGEDFYFCDKMRAAGHRVVVDHDASQSVGHMGDYCYGIMNGT